MFGTDIWRDRQLENWTNTEGRMDEWTDGQMD